MVFLGLNWSRRETRYARPCVLWLGLGEVLGLIALEISNNLPRILHCFQNLLETPWFRAWLGHSEYHGRNCWYGCWLEGTACQLFGLPEFSFTKRRGIWFAPWFKWRMVLTWYVLYLPDIVSLWIIQCGHRFKSLLKPKYSASATMLKDIKIWEIDRIVKCRVGSILFSYCKWSIPSSCPNLCYLCIRTSDFWNNKSLSLFFSCFCWQVCLIKRTILVCSWLGGVQILVTANFLVLCFSKNN